MARSIWTGSLAFGLVNVPVAVFAATEDRTIHFNQFEAGTSDRIRYQRVNERTGKQVELSSIVRGREVGDGDYVLVSDEELEAVEPGRSRTIEISDFVDLDEIDPIYFQKTYYLAPQGEDAERAYALLRDAMAETNRAGIAMFVMRGKQYLVTVRPDGDVLALETMYFADEIRDPGEELGGLPSSRSVRRRELSIATQLIDSMTTSWEPESYRDTYRERVEDLIERKRQGEEIVTESQPPEEGKVVDLMEALRQSAEAARGGRAGKDGAGRRGRQGGAARSSRQGASSKGASSKGASSKTGRRGQQGRAADGGADVDRMSKTELAKLAADAGIQGRSKMSRDELADAVRKARRGTARSAS
ncbi:MAG: Ku protein [Gemmatimonadota bacterium]